MRLSKVETIFGLMIVVLVFGICIDLLFRFSLQDSTLLGDPYYRTDILAHQRAPVALLFCWFVVLLSLILAMLKARK